MAKRSPSNQRKFKFRALKSYASAEWLAESKKKYRQVFDKSEINAMYAEFSFFNKLFDEKDWEADIVLRAYEQSKPSDIICELPVKKNIPKEQHIIFVREGWGTEQGGKGWKEGSYCWEAFVDNESVGKHPFYIYEVGTIDPHNNPYFELEAIKLFEGANQDGKKKKPTYYSTFHDKETRFVWVELKATSKLKKEWMAEIQFMFYNGSRQLKGVTTELQKIGKRQNKISVTSGWGSDYKSSWYADSYTVEVVFMDKLLGVIPFRVDDHFIEGESKLLLPGETGLVLGLPSGKEHTPKSLEDILGDLDQLIGLVGIKAKVKEYAQYLNFLKIRKEKGFQEDQSIGLNLVFTGNPGTGKTTVARMLGTIYYKLGLLSRGHIHEVDRSDIIGEYIGQTAPKMKAAIDKARGGILFIDEAYALARTGDDAKDYGREAIEILVKEMSQPKGDLAVIVAGYPEEMDNFLVSNPGLKSRFNLSFNFKDYTPEELIAISDFWSVKKEIVLDEEARIYLGKKLMEAYRSREKSFGNARYVQTLIDEAKMNLGLRVMKVENPEELSRVELSTIQQQDLIPIFSEQERDKVLIPIDHQLLSEALGELNNLIGLEQVKIEVIELVKLVKFYQEIGKDVLNSFSLHTIFSGNPGTGKTTVARILGKIYKALGLLERGEVVECDRQTLVAGYIGQTATKTAEVVDKAKGSILFIDEAYALSQGGTQDFGREAIETLLKRMEDLRGEIIVIVAGYPEPMDNFLELNPGLKSRFDRKLEFEDYKADELQEIAAIMLAKEGIVPETVALEQMGKYLTYLHQRKNKYFGNARAVRKVVEKSIKNQHLRLAALPVQERNEDMLKSLIFEDVSEFQPGNDVLLESELQRKVGF
ncbi:MAG: AAA family ATPase [Bacteroidota bacterium]